MGKELKIEEILDLGDRTPVSENTTNINLEKLLSLPEREEKKQEVDMTLPEKPACEIEIPDLELPKYKKPDYSHLLDL